MKNEKQSLDICYVLCVCCKRICDMVFVNSEKERPSNLTFVVLLPFGSQVSIIFTHPQNQHDIHFSRAN